ncbi:MAG TPA: PQQ-binding-like beta-propeller repeat protein [Candidatus Acidoferrales bacterium]|nr:PQQ-binding-like beta-propeller repeat protein [Candidatus Acidoferrales bacterium]
MKWLSVLLAMTLLAACSQSQQGATGDWLSAGHDLSFNRYVTSTIGAQNVAQLAPAWTTQIADTGEQESAPIISDGTMYVSTPHNSVLALDAATGALKWDASYTPSEVLDFAVNRGVSIAGGKVFIATQDCRVRALDASTGKELWNVAGCSTDANNWYSMATYVYGNMLLVGVAGGDFGGNGAVQAFDVNNGKKLWQWDTIPAPGQPGHNTWPGDSWKHGGAALWGGLSVDPATSTLYVAPGNPAPDFYNGNRKGDNLYADSVVALDISGPQPKLKWYYKITDVDVHDADPAMPPVLFDGTVNGQKEPLLAIGDKGGNFVILDRTNGTLIHRLAVAHQLGLNQDPTPQGREACPNHGGGVEWNGGAYDPATNYFIVPVTQECGVFFTYAVQPPWQQGVNYHGGPMAKREDGTGQVNAVDVSSGTIAWATPLPYPAQGGALVTSTGLTFTSDLAGNLYALDTKTGKQLWTYATHTAIVAPFSMYTAGGNEYLAILGGEPGNQKTPNVPVSKGDYVMAFRVGATNPAANGTTGQAVALVEAAKGVTQTGTAPYTPAQLQIGKTAYMENCSSCHGAQLQGVSAPALVGAGFAAAKLSISDVRGIVTKQMPLTAPGTLSPATYAAIMAFLSASNCVKPATPAAPFPTTDEPGFKTVVFMGEVCQQPSSGGS